MTLALVIVYNIIVLLRNAQSQTGVIGVHYIFECPRSLTIIVVSKTYTSQFVGVNLHSHVEKCSMLYLPKVHVIIMEVVWTFQCHRHYELM